MHDLNENRSGYHKTKVGWLPNDWGCAAFGQIARRVSKPVAVAKREQYREIGLRSHGRGVFHKDPVLGADLGEKRVFRVQPGALVFNIVFAWEQAVAMTSEAEAGMIASHRFPMFVGRDGKAEATFLLRYFLTPRGKHELGLASPGGAGRNKTLGQEDLTRLPVPLPPLAEQLRIVEVLATWDAALRDVEALIAAQRRRKTGLVQRLLNCTTRLPGFKGDWKEARLGVCATVLMGTSPPSSAYNAVHEGLPLIQGNADLSGGRSAPRCCTTDVTVRCEPGDILMSVRAPAGEFAMSVHEACIGRGIAAIRCKGDTAPGFIYQRLTAFAHEWVRLAQGSTFGAVSGRDIREYALCLPPLPEQRAIAAVLGTADEELWALEEKRAALELQKRGLMQQLLTGASRLPQHRREA